MEPPPKKAAVDSKGSLPVGLRERLEKFGQEHTLHWLDVGKLSAAAAEDLAAQLESLDLARINDAFNSTHVDAGALAERAIEPPEPSSLISLASLPPEDRDRFEKIGMEEITSGRAAVVILGGGQGTRLGFDGPKGLYDVGLPSKKSLFQLYAERLVRLQKVASETAPSKVVVPLFVMTSPLNHATTASFFEANSYFGLEKDHVHFFAQGTLPALTTDGKIIMTRGSSVSESPDGNGGIYNALAVSGALTTLEEQYGARSVHVFSVDNAICKVCDPAFLGVCVDRDVEVGNKVVWKVAPEEKVGVVARKGGLPAVIEYTELAKENAEATDAAGKLLFGAGNICQHYFTVSFLRRVATAYKETPSLIPYHIAKKKIPFADPATGSMVAALEPNGIKLEAFIFDSFPLAANSVILEVKREEEFSPVKNAPGSASDSPDTARAMIMALHRRWAVAAGASISDHGAAFEVSPLISFSGEGLGPILKGRTFDGEPTHLE